MKLSIGVLRILVEQYHSILESAIPHAAKHVLSKLDDMYQGNIFTSMCYLDSICLDAVIKEAYGRCSDSAKRCSSEFDLDQLIHIGCNSCDAFKAAYGEYYEPFLYEYNNVLGGDLVQYIAKHGSKSSTLKLLSYKKSEKIAG